jgi:hypothetical protein
MSDATAVRPNLLSIAACVEQNTFFFPFPTSRLLTFSYVAFYDDSAARKKWGMLFPFKLQTHI